MQNDVFQGKNPFLKSVADACRILAGWKNRYDNEDSRLTEANDGMAFATINKDENKGNKKKDVIWYKCNKIRHYANFKTQKIIGNPRKSLEIADMRDYLEIDFSH